MPIPSLHPALLAGAITLFWIPAVSLAQSSSESSTVEPAPMTLPAISVSATGLPAYIADKPSSIATKTELPPRQTPFSVDQATEELMQDRGDQDVFDTLEGFAGLTTSSTGWDDGASHIRNIQVRGVTSHQSLVNGIRMYNTTFSGSTVRGVDNLESVELLRGPAGLYYGSAEPGGVISYNYKRPEDKAAYVIGGNVDSEKSYGGMIDATGPLNEDATLMYRLVGSLKHHENDQDEYFSEPKSGMVALTFKPDHRFESTLTYERMDKESIPEVENNFLIEEGPLAGQYYPVPKDFFWGSLNDRVKRKSDTVMWDGTWSETEALKIRGGVIYHNYKQSRLITRAHDPEQGPDANGLAQRYVGGRLFKGDSVSASVDISGVVRAGAWRHDWLTGVGYGTSTNESTSGDLHNQSISDGTGPYPVDPIDINNPNYSDYPYADQLWNAAFTRKTERTDKNLYLQDMVHLPNGRTRLLLSGGWSQFETDTEKDPATKLQKWSPRLAIMHDVTDTATVYASYGESFTPQSSPTYLTTDGRYIKDPVEGVQYEVGFKQDLFDANAMFTAAVFSLDKKNVATAIENFECTYGGSAQPSATPEDACYELAGLTRAQGVELRLSGQLMDSWVAQVGYSFTDTKYVDTDNEFAEGRSVKYTPRHSLALWNKFRVHRSASLGEFNLGLGMRAWSETHDSWTDTGTNWNPGYGIVDLGVFWDKNLSASKQLKVSLNISNLFDKQYFDRARFPPNNVLYGDERRAALSVQLSL